MHLSTSSSETSAPEISTPEISIPEISTPDEGLQEKLHASSRLPARGLERRVPDVPWLRVFVTVVSVTLLLVIGWEIEMRHLGLRAGDLEDDRGNWAVERRKVDRSPRDSIVIIGDSRILFDTDLATWQKLTGRRPIQLGRMGTNAQAMLHDLAEDKHFAGLLVIGTAEFSYFGEGSAGPVLEYLKNESPSQRVGTQIHNELSRYLAFLDSHYTLFTLIEQHKWPQRKGVDGAYMDVWKLSESYEGRQSYSWERLERDPYLREHAQAVWLEIWPGPTIKPEEVSQAIANTKTDIDKIRARGGEVVWVRPPSSGPILEIERTRYPRAKAWDRLVSETASFGVYFEDYPTMQNLHCLDSSHLSKKSAIEFTDAYVHVLRERVGWLKAHPASAADGTRTAASNNSSRQ